MELSEYHAKRILHSLGIPFSSYEMAEQAPSYLFRVQIEEGTVVVCCGKQDAKRLFIEKVAERRLFAYQINRLMVQLNMAETATDSFYALCERTVDSFFQLDATKIELSPIVLTPAGTVEAVHAAVYIDSSSLFRQPELAPYVQEKKEGYIELGGTIGCLTNGLALGLATVDELQLAGGKAAGLFDIGAELSVPNLLAGLRLVVEERTVQAVLIHIFTGLQDCGAIGQAVKKEISSWKANKPLVVCFQGTNAAAGVRVFQDKRFKLQATQDLGDAIKQVLTCRS